VVFSPFIVDASLTLLRRVLRGERFWQAHREHHYQVMVRSGLGHRTTALLWYALMAAAGASACATLTAGAPDWWLLLGLWGVTYAVLVIAVNVRCRIDQGSPC
jgi:phospho-N-acetylmuramoyl-pentapeptide-transferase